MSLSNEYQSSPDKATEISCGDRQAKIAYSREFLLSLSELEICKNLPSGFDQLILSELGDASHSNQDRQRTHGSLPLQSFRRNEYGSSPPIRGDSSSYSQGIYGRWENRSSGRSDRDSDSKSDKDSDCGRRCGNQSQRSWQGTEHDGLLGSGSFPRPSGYAVGVSASKVRANDQYKLNRSNEPYHPPRPYKAAPLSRRDTHDSYNDETFGSAECTSEDRVEEERKRRACFELMRKEQHKTLQEKQKVHVEKDKAEVGPDISTLNDTKEEKRLLDNNDGVNITSIETVSSNSRKSILPSQTPTFRPLVPPGFKNMVGEKSSGLISMMHSHSAEAKKNVSEECLLYPPAEENDTFSCTERLCSGERNDGKYDKKNIHLPALSKSEQLSPSPLNMSIEEIGIEDYCPTSVLPEADEDSNYPEINVLNLGGKFKQNDTASILEKIFGNALTDNVDNSMDLVQHQDNKLDDVLSPKPMHSSKFAHWFVEEERKTGAESSSSRPNDLLSLIVGRDKGKSNVSEAKASDHSDFFLQSSELANKSTTNMYCTANGVSESLHKSSKQEVAPVILTCEDLEQTILSEYSEKSSNLQPPLQGSTVSASKFEQARVKVGDHASQHLLSLLQKGVSQDNMTLKDHADANDLEKLHTSDVYNVSTAVNETVEKDAGKIENSGNTLTLETLFGTAFMKELQSFEAPVSVQKDPVGPTQTDSMGPRGLVFPIANNGLFPPEIDRIGSDKVSSAEDFLASNHKQQTKLDRTENWFGYNDPQIEQNFSKSHPELAGKHSGFDGAAEHRLHAEESLLATNGDLNHQLLKFLPAGSLGQSEPLASKKSGDIIEKLSAVSPVVKDCRSTIGSDGSALITGPYNLIERDGRFHNANAPPSAPFPSLQMSPGRPLLQALESHSAYANSQLKLMGPERVIQHDSSSNQQFPASMLQPPFHYPNVGAGFDLPSHHPRLPQMQNPGNYPSHLNDFPRSMQDPHASRYMQELNPTPGYPFGLRQPNVGGLRMQIPAPNINGGSGSGSGSNHPDAFQRLIEMERRANSKQNPSFGLGRSQGLYSNDLDATRYR